MLVAVIVGPDGVNTLLVLSQVVLSVVLPFVAFPLVWLTSSRGVMRVRVERERVASGGESEGENAVMPSTTTAATIATTPMSSNPSSSSSDSPSSSNSDDPEYEYIDYSNGKTMMGLGYAIWLVIAVANVYVLVTLALGSG